MDLGLRGVFLNLAPKESESKINECHCIKLKNVCTAKETANKVKRQPTEWEETSANDIFDKELISKCVKNSYNSTITKID